MVGLKTRKEQNIMLLAGKISLKMRTNFDGFSKKAYQKTRKN
jgi:hypothetical protein